MSQNAIQAALDALRNAAGHACGIAPLSEDVSPLIQKVVQQAAEMLQGDGWTGMDQPLQSIFTRITAKEDETATPDLYLPCLPLRVDSDAFFPCIGEANAQKKRDTETLTKPIRAELDALQSNDLLPQVKLERLLYTLQRYAWCLPSPLPAVSLYDFARTHAAIASALALSNNDGNNVVLLVGDISGVQDFIYNLTAEGATRQLRGRSFYLQLLSEAVAHYILKTFDLPITSIIYNGGGHFYIVLPSNANERIEGLRNEIGIRMLVRHRGALYVALGSVLFGARDSWKTVWDSLKEQMEADKRRRFADLKEEGTLYKILFTPHQPEVPLGITDASASVPQDALSKSLEGLGRDLHNQKYLIVHPHWNIRPESFNKTMFESARWYEVMRDFGLQIYPKPKRLGTRRCHTRVLTMYDQRDDAEQQARERLKHYDVVGTRYTVNVAPLVSDRDIERHPDWKDENEQPLRKHHVKTFDLLVEQSCGIKRLGVLRMDVDDLGDIFGSRLQREDGLASLAYTASLSAAMSRFFEGWVGTLCRRINDENESKHSKEDGGIYAVYSGGDDLFIVGSWHLLPRLAAEIRNDFIRYTTGKEPGEVPEPPITVSAGITLHGSKFPLYQAAKQADDALNDKAKAYQRDRKQNGRKKGTISDTGQSGEAPDDKAKEGRKKDAICFLDQVVAWENFAEVQKIKDTLVELVEPEGKGVPSALLMTIQALYMRYKAGSRGRYTRSGTPQVEYGPWVWQGAYTLTRIAERCKVDAQEQVRELRDKIITNVEDRYIERAGLAARWAQLLVRGRKDAEQ